MMHEEGDEPYGPNRRGIDLVFPWYVLVRILPSWGVLDRPNRRYIDLMFPSLLPPIKGFLLDDLVWGRSLVLVLASFDFSCPSFSYPLTGGSRRYG